MWLELKYVKLLQPYLSNFKQRSETLYNFSCPICGDSSMDSRKARGYVYEVSNNINYMCHNCGISISFINFLKTVDQRLYDQYTMERLYNRNVDKKLFSKKKIDLTDNDNDIDDLLKCSTLDDSHEAIKYLEGRMIPKDRWNQIYYIPIFKDLEKRFPKYKNRLGEDSRIIIPIKNRNKDLIGLIARRINNKDSKLRYVMLRLKDNEPLFFNYENVNLNKKIYVFEGAIDSLFFKNSIAVSGSDFHKFNSINNTVIFDNQPRNMEIVKKMDSIIKNNRSIVIWPENFEKNGDDVNSMVMNGLDTGYIKDIIDQNTFRGLTAKVKFNTWKKINI